MALNMLTLPKNIGSNLSPDEINYMAEIMGIGKSIDSILIQSNSGTPDYYCDITVGQCLDSTYRVFMPAQSIMTKRFNSIFAAGTNLGGLYTSALVANTTYFIFKIIKDSDQSIDYYADISLSAANKPAGYTYFRRVSVFVTDNSAKIVHYRQEGNEITYTTRVSQTFTPIGDTSTHSLTINLLPTGLNMNVSFNIFHQGATSGDGIYFHSTYVTNQSAAIGFFTTFLPDDGTNVWNGEVQLEVDTSANINYISSVSSGMGSVILLIMKFIDKILY